MENFAAGIHDIPAERYDAAQGVSCSMLNILAASTPMHLRSAMSGTPKKQTPALRTGVLAHYAVLQGDIYQERFHVAPEGMMFNTKKGKDWKADHADKPIVKFEEAVHLTGMVEAIARHPFARRVLMSGKPEQSLFVYDEHETLRKSRLDSLTDGNIIPDIKTCVSASNEYFERLISRFRYHVRSAFYLDNCRLLNMDKEHYMFIAVEKTPPYAVRCLKMDGDCITWGRKCYQSDLQTYRNCLANDEWPGYEDGFADITLPQWEMRQIYELI